MVVETEHSVERLTAETEAIKHDHGTTNECETNKNQIEELQETGVDPEKWEDVLGSGSIMKKILFKGDPEKKPQRHHVCEINYICKLENGLEVDRQQHLFMQIDGCDVVQGLDLSIAMMTVGEKCQLIIDPRLAFGAKGLPPLIPGNTKVVYEIELVSIQEEDPDNLCVSVRKERGNKKKERGNWWYMRGENTLAIQCYRRALDYLDELEGGIKDPKPDNNKDEISDVDLQSLLEDRLNVCNNMAAAQIKLGLYDPALNSLETVLRCQPENLKALYRKAKVYRAKSEYVSATKCLQKANEISPDDLDIQKEMSAVNALIKKQKVSEKELAQRMFNLKDNDVKKKNEKNARSKFQMWTVFGVSVMVTLASIAAYKFKYV